MLTAKIISEGCEVVKEITSCIFIDNTPTTGSSNLPCLTLFLPPSPERDVILHEEIREGTVFVMNDNGKTVANYVLPYRVIEGQSK
jgi:hypothetical protein